MNESALLRKMEQARESAFELPNGKTITLRIPLQTQYIKLFRSTPEDLIGQVVVGWSGVTEADLLGAGVGSDEAVPFSAELAVQWFCDEPEIASAIVGRTLELVSARAKLADADEKN